MKSLVRLAETWTATLLASFAFAGAPVPIPETISANNGRLAWVSAGYALDDSGRLKTDLVDSPLLRANARRNAKHRRAQTEGAAAAEECETFLGTYLEHFEPANSLKDAAAGAELIVSGRVVSIGEGFMHNLPGSLLRISGAAIKGNATEEVYLFYPLARIRTAEGLVCARPVGEYQPPAVGDELIIFSMNPALVAGKRMILQVDPAREIIHQATGGRRIVPAAFARDLAAELTLREIATKVAGEANVERSLP